MNFLLKNKLVVAGIITGALAGYAYWYFIGCASGKCAITSSAPNSTVYGAIMGGLLFSIITKKKINKDE